MNSAVKQRLNCNTDKVCNCLIQFLLTMVPSIEECVFLVEYVFREDNRYADFMQEQSAEKFPETPAPHRSVVRRLNQLKTVTTAYIRNISQAHLHKAFAIKLNVFRSV
jgi:hypothetical protein